MMAASFVKQAKMECLMLPIKILLVTLDLLIFIVTFGWIRAKRTITCRKERMCSVPVAKDPSHRVDPAYKKALVEKPRNGGATLYDLAKDAFARYGSRNCMGSRRLLGWKVPGKVREFSSEVKWHSFAEIGNKSQKFGAAICAMGVKAAPPVTDLNQCTEPCRIAIFENTCAEWMIAAIGAFSQSVTVVTVYATLGMDAVVEAIKDNAIPLLVCNAKDLVRVVSKCSRMSSLHTIVYTMNMVAPSDSKVVPDAPLGVLIVEFDFFCASGNVSAYPPTPPNPDSCAVVTYTSGSTGKPKGVVITHRQVVATCAAAEIAFGIRKGKDVYVAYLPLAHIFEFMAEFTILSQGNVICYADPKSLTKFGAYSIGALEQYAPTLMAAVPKIWDVINKRIHGKIAAASPFSRFFANTAFEWRGFALKHGFDTPLFNNVMFYKLAKVVGGKLRFALSIGGPLHSDVQECIRVAFGIDFVQGYGMTETTAGIAVQVCGDFRPNIVGKPMASVEVKLVSTPNICDRLGRPYCATDTTDAKGNRVFGRGEITVRGPGIASGYYMMPKETKDSYEENGWFHTGDIGQFMSDGSLRLVDQKKNLVKLKGGEYVALEKMEMTYGNSSFVNAFAGGILCYGNGDMDRPVALIQLNEATAMKWAKENGIAGDMTALKRSDLLQEAILSDLSNEHAKSDLSHLEKLVGVAVLTVPWTISNGCLTAANKLDRRKVVQLFSAEFEEVKQKGIF